MQKVFFHSADRKLSIKGKTEIKEAVLSIFKKEKIAVERLDYIFCSDDYLLDINLRFLKHDYYTDIITFDLSDSDKIKAEIYISLDRVKENAALIRTTFPNELVRVVFHGALHLCGYKDKSIHENKKMREMEDFFLNKFLK